MINWISEHSGVLQVLSSGVMTLVWIVYLQAFLIGYFRQRRPEILINLGAGAGLRARCFVTNLGLEPIYLLDVIVEIGTDEGVRRAIITDRTELSEKELSNPAEATNQGPLSSGSFIDIGDFETLVQRACSGEQKLEPNSDVRSIEITAVVATAAKSSFAGATRKYMVAHEDDERLHLRPVQLGAKQIHSRAGRARLRRELEQRLAR